jgi:hypothetical protein
MSPSAPLLKLELDRKFALNRGGIRGDVQSPCVICGLRGQSFGARDRVRDAFLWGSVLDKVTQ